jgi:hypothetical protein
MVKMSDSEGSNFSDNESERGSNQQSDSDVEVIKHITVSGLPNCIRVMCRSQMVETCSFGNNIECYSPGLC